MVLKVRGLGVHNISTLVDMENKLDISSRFGERLRFLRKKKGFSQEAFAEAAGLDRSYVGGIERGERNITLRTMEALAQALEVDIAKMMKQV